MPVWSLADGAMQQSNHLFTAVWREIEAGETLDSCGNTVPNSVSLLCAVQPVHLRQEKHLIMLRNFSKWGISLLPPYSRFIHVLDMLASSHTSPHLSIWVCSDNEMTIRAVHWAGAVSQNVLTRLPVLGLLCGDLSPIPFSWRLYNASQFGAQFEAVLATDREHHSWR